MFLILIHYKKPLEMIDKYLIEHRDYLEAGYQKNFFIVSGPRSPRTGGIILSQIQDRTKLDEVLHQDPFYLNDLVEFEVIEFVPVKHHPHFAAFL